MKKSDFLKSNDEMLYILLEIYEDSKKTKTKYLEKSFSSYFPKSNYNACDITYIRETLKQESLVFVDDSLTRVHPFIWNMEKTQPNEQLVNRVLPLMYENIRSKNENKRIAIIKKTFTNTEVYIPEKNLDAEIIKVQKIVKQLRDMGYEVTCEKKIVF